MEKLRCLSVLRAKVKLHSNYRITFKNWINWKESQENKLPEVIEEKATEGSFNQLECERKHYNHCFICNEKKPLDIKIFNDGRISRYSTVLGKKYFKPFEEISININIYHVQKSLILW